MELIERLQLVMKLNNLSPSAFADEIGVQRSGISHLLSGRNKPSLDLIQKTLARFPKTDSEWLLTGKQGNTNEAPSVPSQDILPDSGIKEEKKAAFTASQPSIVQNSAKRVSKILVFYDDHTFDEYLPSQADEN